MVNIKIITLFPNLFDPFYNYSIIKKAFDKQLVNLEIVDLRKFANNKHNKVDDTPYGGGAGMVIMLEPVLKAIESVQTENSYVVLLDPKGKVYEQNVAKELVLKKDLILICGHYEGIDHRLNHFIDATISIGDYVLSGGEIAALVLCDSIIRLIPNAINEQSLVVESFEDYLLDYPVYTKPQTFLNYTIPSQLLSGNHKLISKIRHEWREELTQKIRPDLYEKYLQTKNKK